LLPDDI
jgi:WD40 repeat protein